MVGPYPEVCEFCLSPCDFRPTVTIMSMTKGDEMAKITAAADKRDTAETKRLALELAAWKMGIDPAASNPRMKALAYCIAAFAVRDADMDDSEKREFMRKIANEPEIRGVGSDTDKIAGEITTEKVTETVESSNKETGRAAAISAEKERSSASTQSAEELKTKMAELRAKRMKELEKSSSHVISSREKVLRWLKSDQKFGKLVVQLRNIGKGFEVEYDPESEGYLAGFRLLVASKTIPMGDNSIEVIKLRAEAEYDVKYPYSLIIGFNKKGKPVAVSFYGALPSNKQEIKRELERIDPKKIGDDWDRLQIIINSDKSLRKKISKLPLKSPIQGTVDDIEFPISIKSAGNKMIISMTFFFKPSVKPSFLFLDVLEHIAADVDNLHEIDETIREKSAGETGFFDFGEPTAPSDGFHFIEMGSQIEIPTCPNCGRPFPDPTAEYRRCPYCLYKLM